MKVAKGSGLWPAFWMLGTNIDQVNWPQSGEIDIRTPAANGAMRGTQLFVQVATDGSSRFQVLEGQVELVCIDAKKQLVPLPKSVMEQVLTG